MGRGQKRGRTQRKHFKENRENTWKYKNHGDYKDGGDKDGDDKDGDVNSQSKNRDPLWEPFNTENTAFDEYYKEQGIVSEDEWDVFISILRKPLPAAFRINSSAQFYKDILWQLENDFSKSLEFDHGHENETQSIRPLPWYPGNLAWHSNFSRMQLRKNQTLERFHEFLKLENETGNITRQEAVSMVPPLFLDVSPDHHILDMCAAPGSKTFQLLEMMHHSSDVGLLPNGLVIANDVDVQRCNLLIHQTKRMCNANLIVTNHEAQNFPSCKFNSDMKDVKINPIEEAVSNQLQFDRVLCDVPCSGDGTLRKAPDIWRKWNSGMGNGLHRLQIQIVMRGLALLKVGGQMVYSTCSMNPVENEAVVAEILRRCGSSVELVDVSRDLPLLTRRPGLKKWKIKDKGLWLHSYADVPLSRKGIILESMFPSDVSAKQKKEPTESGAPSSDQPGLESDIPVDFERLNRNIDESLPLERCMRIVPHDQNSGAFFIAVLKKLAPLQVIPGNSVHQKKSAEDKTRADREKDQSKQVQIVNETSNGDSCNCKNNSDEREQGNMAKSKPQMQGKWRGVDPVVIFEDRDVINSIRSFYGIEDSFPLEGHLVTRNNDSSHVKRIYYVSKSVVDTVKMNFQADQALKITSLGLKIFERQTSKEAYATSTCAFRISSEGLPLLLPHMRKQIVYASWNDFKNLLKYRNIKFSDFVNENFAQRASELTAGCCVIVLNNDSQTDERTVVDASTIAIGCWKGKTSLSVMVSEVDSQQLLERLAFKHKDNAGTQPETDTNDMDYTEEDLDSAVQVG